VDELLGCIVVIGGGIVEVRDEDAFAFRGLKKDAIVWLFNLRRWRAQCNPCLTKLSPLGIKSLGVAIGSCRVVVIGWSRTCWST
jgi:hypothetical protein